MGNICRSPSAEGFFALHLQKSDYQDQISVDSAGTHSYHIGHSPDHRAIATAADFDVKIEQLRARKVRTSDFQEYDLIIAMDHVNLTSLRTMRPAGSRATVHMMMEFHPVGTPKEVPDPYYGGMDGFTYMFELLEQATAGLLQHVEEQLDRAG
jgi:protein-tyrosine phosphatase